MEVAADAFDQLSAQHIRSGVRANRRILLIALLTAFVTAGVIIAAIDSSRSSSQYSSAVAWQHKAAEKCDAPLGRRRMWFFGVVTEKEMCVPHYGVAGSHLLAIDESPLTFLVLGDWGRDGMCCQRDVAAEMSIAAIKLKPQFVVSVGDNFYEAGIKGSDDGQVDRSWRGVYVDPHESMRELPWKVILGNHDHEGEIAAQTVLGRDDKLWEMPNKYYFETVGNVFMAFLDTTVMYYTDEDLQSDFRKDESVTHDYRDEQVAALRKELAGTKATWKIVFGHHPFFSSAEHAVDEVLQRRQLQTILMPILKEYKVAAYICGHEHSMEHHEKDGIQFFVSGAGSKISPLEGYQEESRFALDQQGFMAFSLSKDEKQLRVQAVDLRGHIVYTTFVRNL